MKIDHIAIYVKDLEASALFFETYFLGKRNCKYMNNKTGFTSYFITFDDGARIELMNMPSVADKQANIPFYGYAHIAFRVGSKGKVNEPTKRFETDGYRVLSYPRMTGDGYYESCIADGEGNLIEIME
jgi:lactoylglutathione lyase